MASGAHAAHLLQVGQAAEAVGKIAKSIDQLVRDAHFAGLLLQEAGGGTGGNLISEATALVATIERDHLPMILANAVRARAQVMKYQGIIS